MRTVQRAALVILDKLRELLTTEPARLIGYGFAAVIYLALRFLEAHDFIAFPDATFDEISGVVFATMASLVIIVESIRRFVYSPQTYIEDLADEAAAAHEAAHLEEAFRELQAELERAAAERAAKQTVSVGSVKAKGSSTKAD